jgi:hypothetical protein
MNSTLNSGKACYRQFSSEYFAFPTAKSVRIKTWCCKTINLPVLRGAKPGVSYQGKNTNLHRSKTGCWEHLNLRGMNWRQGERKLQNEKHINLCSSTHIITITKPRKMRWTGQAARMRWKICIKFWFGSPKGRDDSGDLGVGGRAVLKRTLWKSGLEVWTGFNWIRTGASSGLLWAH